MNIDLNRFFEALEEEDFGGVEDFEAPPGYVDDQVVLDRIEQELAYNETHADAHYLTVDLRVLRTFILHRDDIAFYPRIERVYKKLLKPTRKSKTRG